MTVDEGINPKLQQHSLTLDGYHLGLRMNMVKSNETFEVQLNTLGLATPNVDTKFHKT